MLVIDPPATPAYVPSNTAIAYICTLWMSNDMPTTKTFPEFILLDLNCQSIGYNLASVTPPTDDQLAAASAALTVAGDTKDQATSRACIPLVASMFGLTAAVYTGPALVAPTPIATNPNPGP